MASKKDVFASGVVRSYLLDFVGEDGLKAAKSLPSSKAKSEYEVAEETKININRLRSILYKFYSKNLVFYHRLRDEHKGWYIYHWKFFPDKLVETIIKEKQQLLERLEDEDEELSGIQFYTCSSCSEKYDFESAFNHDFTCPNCRSSLTLLEKKKTSSSRTFVKQVKRELKELKQLAS